MTSWLHAVCALINKCRYSPDRLAPSTFHLRNRCTGLKSTGLLLRVQSIDTHVEDYGLIDGQKQPSDCSKPSGKDHEITGSDYNVMVLTHESPCSSGASK